MQHPAIHEAAVIGPWVMLECVRTKLPHYLLPCFPPLAFLTADAIVRPLLPADPTGFRGQGKPVYPLLDRVFLVAGLTFLLVLPLLWFLKTPEDYAGKKASEPAMEVAVE